MCTLIAPTAFLKKCEKDKEGLYIEMEGVYSLHGSTHWCKTE